MLIRKNRYFLDELPNINMTKIYSIIVGRVNKQPISPDGTQILFKLPLGDTKTHIILSNAVEKTEEEAKAIRRLWDPKIEGL